MPPRQPQPGRDLATFTALIGLAVMALGLLLLVALVWPAVLGIITVIVGAVLFVALHYLVWGWWMPRDPRLEEDEPLAERDVL